MTTNPYTAYLIGHLFCVARVMTGWVRLCRGRTDFGGKQAQATTCRIALLNYCAKNEVRSQHTGSFCRHNPADRTLGFAEMLMFVNT